MTDQMAGPIWDKFEVCSERFCYVGHWWQDTYLENAVDEQNPSEIRIWLANEILILNNWQY